MRALLALLLLGSTAYAGSNELFIGSHVRALRTDSANALTNDSLAGVQLGYARALDLPLIPGVQLWATGSFGYGTADGTMFQVLTTEVDALNLSVGGRARYPLKRWLNATARLDLGSARAAVAIRDNAGHTAADSGWGAFAQAAAGFELLQMSERGYSLGIRLELGYAVASPVDLTATPESGSDGTLQLGMDASSLGSLNLSGKVFAFSVSSQF